MDVKALAAASGVSFGYLYRLAKLGCPLTSPEDVLARRRQHAQRPVGSRGKNRVVAAPPDPIPFAPEARPSRERFSAQTLDECLRLSVRIEELAAEAVAAVKSSDFDPAIFGHVVNAYNRAQKGRMEAEKRVLELMEKRKQLVPMDAVRELIQRAWGPLVAHLRAAGPRVGPLANPADPELAEEVFREEIEDAIADARRSYDFPREDG